MNNALNVERLERPRSTIGDQPASSPAALAPHNIIGRGEFLEKELAENGDLSCWKCGLVVTEEECQLDHIIPSVEGGSDAYENSQLLCLNCHREKTRNENRARRKSP